MRIVVISDLHLSDRFEPSKYEFVRKTISESDQVVLLGDFWDGYIISFDRFVASPWNKLFPILKSKKSIYLFGNHDRKNWSNSKTDLFSDVQAQSHQITIGDNTYVFEHGNRIYKAIDDKIALPRFRPLGLLHYWKYRFAFEKHGPKYFERYQSENNQMKEWATENLANNTMLICGHTHLAEMDRHNKFANSGFIGYGYGSYLVIDEQGIDLAVDRY